ncbi:four helix bundle protein [Catalinimonas alkaloidigena]|uniref:Four helix bundle protein n=1 Tax=Catalinimonas alkaloidigena TaxID=1075417 RepID=A0A1G9FBM7_9BACT|nr:four helix bundle protein [Catalinimonas alkaloidigena]SDK85728.1 four helix bundle protein [Catalinimonas alkaloidigena]
MGSLKQLKVYQKAFQVAMDIFELSKVFPQEEKYALTDQVRRASRAVCANLAEAYRKRQYPAHFVAKVSDADAENAEVQVWIDFAYACRYWDEPTKNRLTQASEEIGRMLNTLLRSPEKFTNQVSKN